MTVRWRGQTAAYSTDERQIMQQLTVREQAFVHTLKATMDGQISQCDRADTIAPGVASPGETLGNGNTLGPGQEGFALVGSIPTAETVYTDPEELEFGKPKRRPKIYALVCTWKQSCVVPTKREGEFWMKVWKAWYECQDWKVRSHDTGYFASKGSERHAIGLDEYDRESKERIR